MGIAHVLQPLFKRFAICGVVFSGFGVFFFLLKKFILSVEAQGRENQMLSLKTYVFLMSNDSSDLSFCKARNVLIPVLFFFFFFSNSE